MLTSEVDDRQSLANLEATCPPGVEVGRWRSVLSWRIEQKAQLTRVVSALSKVRRGKEDGGLLSSMCRALKLLRSEVVLTTEESEPGLL